MIKRGMIVEQFLPAFHYGDAIGNSTLRLHRFLLAQGVESRIVSLTIDENMTDKATFFRDYRENPDSIKILHFAIPSELTDYFLQARGKKVMVYHNITPEHFFIDFSQAMVRFTREGRLHLQRLSRAFDLSVADSTFNARELQALDYPHVSVFPIMIDLEEYAGPHSRPYFNLLRDERKNIIFVGRITPNKRIEDLVKVLFFYKKYISPSVRLIVAGKTETLPKYFLSVRDLAGRFYLTADDIVFTGHIPFPELLAVYRLGDVFLSMSEHEGFCLPLIESCFFRVPVIAYDTGAVAETLGGAGLLVKEKQYEYVAGLVERLAADEALRRKLQELQERRIETYRAESRPEGFFRLLEEL